jgi:SAM-dependent methyltransferase
MFFQNAALRFSDKVEHYVKYRPSYPDAVIELFQSELELTSESVIADIGSGTGKSAELFLKHGCNVFAVEPNENMRAAAEDSLSRYPNFISINGTSDHTTLESNSIHIALAAQAFHWFKPKEARLEFQQILKPNGFAALMWNVRKSGTAFHDDYEALLKTFGTDYNDLVYIDASKFQMFFGSNYHLHHFENHRDLDLDSLKGLLLSASYIPKETDIRYAPMLEALTQIFDMHQTQATVRFELETKVFFGKIK